MRTGFWLACSLVWPSIWAVPAVEYMGYRYWLNEWVSEWMKSFHILSRSLLAGVWASAIACLSLLVPTLPSSHLTSPTVSVKPFPSLVYRHHPLLWTIVYNLLSNQGQQAYTGMVLGKLGCIVTLYMPLPSPLIYIHLVAYHKYAIFFSYWSINAYLNLCLPNEWGPGSAKKMFIIVTYYVQSVVPNPSFSLLHYAVYLSWGNCFKRERLFYVSYWVWCPTQCFLVHVKSVRNSRL